MFVCLFVGLITPETRALVRSSGIPWTFHSTIINMNSINVSVDQCAYCIQIRAVPSQNEPFQKVFQKNTQMNLRPVLYSAVVRVSLCFLLLPEP